MSRFVAVHFPLKTADQANCESIFLWRISEVRNDDRKDINIIGHYVVSISVMPFNICTLSSKKLKGRTESYFILF